MTAVGRALLILLFLLIPFTRVQPIFPADTFKEVQTVIVIAKPVTENLLEIPILNLSEQIALANPFKLTDYMPVIADKVARATGTSDNLIYLFAHAAPYYYKGTQSRAIFANLNFLTENDRINLYGKTYYVTGKTIVAATDLTPLTQKPTVETLVLQTCLPGAGYAQRLIVTAKPYNQLALK